MSFTSLSTEPKKNCAPKVRHSAGRIEAGFRSFSGLKFTLADVLLYVAFALFVLKVGSDIVSLKSTLLFKMSNTKLRFQLENGKYVGMYLFLQQHYTSCTKTISVSVVYGVFN